jgi:predicted nucleic acid-binding protein
MKAWLLDTGPIVAFFDRSDMYHQWTAQQWSRAPMPFLTCEAVLAEASYLLSERAGLPGAKILALIERKIVELPFRLEEHASPVAHLMEKYSDQEIQLADACLVRMSELKRDCHVFTLDKTDFQLFRRFDRQVIPLITPD